MANSVLIILLPIMLFVQLFGLLNHVCHLQVIECVIVFGLDPPEVPRVRTGQLPLTVDVFCGQPSKAIPEPILFGGGSNTASSQR